MLSWWLVFSGIVCVVLLVVVTGAGHVLGIPLFSVLMMVARPGQAEAGQGSLPDMLVDSALLSPLFHHNSVQHPLKSEQRRPSVLLWLCGYHTSPAYHLSSPLQSS